MQFHQFVSQTLLAVATVATLSIACDASSDPDTAELEVGADAEQDLEFAAEFEQMDEEEREAGAVAPEELAKFTAAADTVAGVCGGPYHYCKQGYWVVYYWCCTSSGSYACNHKKYGRCNSTQY